MNKILRGLRNPIEVLIYFIRHFVGVKWPDSFFIRVIYFLRTKRRLNLNNPCRFTEKLQWLKLNDRKPLYTNLVDKYNVKKEIAKKIGEKHIIPTIGVWNSENEIEFDKLPKQFVLKTTHGGGSFGVIVCQDKDEINIENVKCKLRKALKQNLYQMGREWPYKNVRRQIIAEQYMGENLADYKFFCFNGEPRYCQVIKGRNNGETIDFFDMSWNHQDFIGLNPSAKHSTSPIPKPIGLDNMIKIAKTLCSGIPFVRVDMYQIGEMVYFGEMTFYPYSGWGRFTPDNWDFKLGDMLNIQK